MTPFIGLAGVATAGADARQGPDQGADRRRSLVLRTQVGRVPALVFRDGDDIVLLSRSGKDLGRYFPEVVEAVRDELAPAVRAGRRDRGAKGDRRPDPAGLESPSRRVHPAESRITMLSKETPAHFIGFDALATGDRSLLGEPLRSRRQALIESVHEKQWCHVTRTTEDPALGAQWLEEFEGAGLDGVIAKRLDGPYLPGKREMVKIKHHRDADCVAIGYRIHKSGEGIGSILLGLYRDDGELQMVGGAASFTAKARLSLLADLELLRIGEDVRDCGTPAAGTRSRANGGFRCARAGMRGGRGDRMEVPAG